jgi:hypothetical protein
MPTTNIEGPNSHTSIGTDIGDGVNYASISSTQANRVLETSAGSSAMAATATPSGVLFTNFFNASQIPAGATILGVEVVFGTDFDGSGNSNIGSFGSSTGTFDVECYLHNGTSYSSKLTFLSTPSGVTLSNSDTTAEFNGANRRYVNTTLGDDVGFGGTADLAGLSWDPADQANFGFAITFQNESSGMVAGITRGFGLRVTYQEGATAEKVNSIISGSIAKLDTVVGNTIAKFNGLVLTGAAPPSLFSKQYQFEDQTTAEGTTSNWSPSNTHSDWVNGTSAVNGTYWGRTSNKTVKGWNCGQDGTGSGGTGPNGGVNPLDGSHDTSSDGDRYLYSESSSNRSLYAFVTRMPGFNFSTEMTNTGNNLNLKFWVHAYGSTMGDLYVYIDTNTSSNHSTATELLALESFSGFTANSSVWQQQTISLNSYRATDAVHYIYFVTQNGTSFRSDMAIDNVEFIEG